MFNERSFQPQDLEACRSILSEIANLFEEGRETEYAAAVRAPLTGTDRDLQRFLSSGNLWGGMGSIPDCAFYNDPGFGFDTNARNRKKFEELMVKLGRRLIEAGKASSATKRWVSVFENEGKGRRA